MQIQLSDHFTYPRLFRFTLPSIVMMIVTSVYSVVDGLFVSNLVGDAALAAVNIVFPLTMIVGAFGFMLGTGGSAEVARVMGMGEDQRAKEYFTTLILAILALGVVLSAGCILFLRPLCAAFGANEALMGDCLSYGYIMLAGSPLFMFQTSFQSFLVAAERPKMGLALAIGSGIANIGFDYLFIGPLDFGVAGAALGTVSSYAVGGLIPLLYFLAPNRSRLRLVKTKLYPRMLLRSCANGSSELMSNISTSLVSALYNRCLMSIAGEQGVAALSVIMYVNFVFAAAFLGFTMGVAPVFSYQYGAGSTGELKSLFGKSVRIIGALSLAMVAAAQLLAGPLAALFVGYDPALKAMTEAGFRLFALSFLFNGWNIFGSGFFTALGDGKTSALLSFLRTLLFQCGAIALLPMLFDLDGVWWATAAAEGAALLVTLWFLWSKRKTYQYA